MAAQEHSSYFSVSGELTENAETLGKTPIGDRRRAELKILWSLAPCGFDPRPRHHCFSVKQAILSVAHRSPFFLFGRFVPIMSQRSWKTQRTAATGRRRKR